MTERETMLESTEPTLLGYMGAAFVGWIFHIMFAFVSTGDIQTASLIFVGYMVTIAYMDNVCELDNSKIACQFNEFWITLSALINSRITNKFETY